MKGKGKQYIIVIGHCNLTLMFYIFYMFIHKLVARNLALFYNNVIRLSIVVTVTIIQVLILPMHVDELWPISLILESHLIVNIPIQKENNLNPDWTNSIFFTIFFSKCFPIDFFIHPEYRVYKKKLNRF